MILSILQWLATAYLIWTWLNLHRRVNLLESNADDLERHIMILSLQLREAEDEIASLKPSKFE
ncbi:hypothetical protein WI25_01415 [Burkholderia cepacia]|nr:hypothetical protein WI25_01415 [Burkholderia cepacia]